MNALRHGSVIAQLENDQLLETQGDEIERAFRRGHNHGIRHAINVIRLDHALATDASADEVARSFVKLLFPRLGAHLPA